MGDRILKYIAGFMLLLAVQISASTPSADTISQSGTEDTAMTITLGGTDPDGGFLTYQIVSQPSNGSVSLLGDTVTYTPNNNYSGLDSFTYKSIDDDNDESGAATVTVTINSTIDTFSVSDYVLSVGHNESLTFTLKGDEAEGRPVTFNLTSSPQNGTLTGVDGTYTYTPGSGFSGEDSFTYTANTYGVHTSDDENYTLGDGIRDIIVEDNKIFVANDQNGLAYLKMEDPTDPLTNIDVEYKAIDSNRAAQTVAKVPGSDYVFVGAGYYGTYLYEIDDSQQTSITEVAFDSSRVHDLAISESGNWMFGGNEYYDYLLAFDIASPENFDQVTNLSMPEIKDVDVTENIVFVARDSETAGTGEGGLVIVEFDTTAETLTERSEALIGFDARSVLVDGSYVYLGGSEEEYVLRIVDVSDLDNPVEVGKLGFGNSGKIWDIKKKGDILIFAETTDDRIYMVNVADPTFPKIVYKSSKLETRTKLDYDGTNLYIGMGSNNKLRIYPWISSDSQSVDVTVTMNVVEGPSLSQAISDITTRYQTSEIDIDLTEHFASPESDPLSYTVLSNSNSSLISTSISNGILSLSIDSNERGSATISLKATGGTSGTYVNDSFDIDIYQIPVLSVLNKSISTDEDTSVAVDFNGSISWDVSLNYILDPAYVSGSITTTAVEDTYTYTPTADYHGTDYISVQVISSASIELSDENAEISRTDHVLVHNGYAYVSAYTDDTRVYNVKDPLNPTLVTTLSLTDKATETFIDGDYLFVTCYQGSGGSSKGIQVWDISDPENPSKVSSQGRVKVNTVFVDNGFAYIGSDNYLKIIDITDPSDVSSYVYNDNNSEVDIVDIFLINNVGYFADKGSIYIVSDLEDLIENNLDLSTQVIIDEVSDLAAQTSSTSASDSFYQNVADILVEGNYAYLSARELGFAIWDLSNPTSPTEVYFEDPGVANSTHVNGDVLYVVAETAIRRYDVRDPSNPVLEEVFEGLAGSKLSAMDMDSDGFGYVADDDRGLITYLPQISSRITLSMTVDSVLDNPVVDPIPDMNYRYQTESVVVNLEDYISTPEPESLSYTISNSNSSDLSMTVDGAVITFELSNVSASATISVEAEGDTTGLTSSDAFDINVFKMPLITISDKSVETNEDVSMNIDLEASFAMDVDVELTVTTEPTSGNLATTDTDGIYDYTPTDDFHGVDNFSVEMDTLAQINLFDEDANLTKLVDVKVSGNYAYIADYTNGVRIYDVTDPWGPVLLSTLNNTVNSTKVFIYGHELYVITGTNGGKFARWDISDPTSPVLHSQRSSSGGLTVFADQNYTYTGSGIAFKIQDKDDLDTDLYKENSSGTYINDIFVDGNVAYIAEGDNFIIVDDLATLIANDTSLFSELVINEVSDITQTSSPSVDNNLYKNIRDVYVSGDYAYLSAHGFGLAVLDVSTPGSPVEVYFEDTGTESVLSTFVKDDVLYVVLAKGVKTYDITDPSSPVYIETYQDLPGDDISDIVIDSDNIAYLADDTQGLMTYIPKLSVKSDVNITINSVLDKPVAQPFSDLATRYQTEDITIDVSEHFSTPEPESLSYTITNSNDDAVTATLAGSTLTIDFNNAQATSAITVTAEGGTTGLQSTGNFEVAVYKLPILTVDTAPSLETDEDTNASIDLAASFSFDTGLNYSMEQEAVSGSIATSSEGVYDYSPTLNFFGSDQFVVEVISSKSVSLYDENAAVDAAHYIVVTANVAYLSDRDNGLTVYDISDPQNPEKLSTLNNTLKVNKTLIKGNYLVLAVAQESNSDVNKGLQVWDISDPRNPVFKDSAKRIGARTIAVEGDYAYMGTSSAFKIIDLSDPENIGSQLYNDNTQMSVNDVFVDGSVGYVAEDDGVIIIEDLAEVLSSGDDLSNEVWIDEVADLSSQNSETPASDAFYAAVQDIHVEGDYAYLSASSGGFVIWDVSNPVAPVELYFEDPGTVNSMTVKGDVLYLAADSEMRTYDISNPASPVLRESFDGLSGTALNEIAIDDDNIVFAADLERGLVTLVPQLSAKVTVSVTVDPVLDAPEFTSTDNISVTENETAVLTVMASDGDGDTVTFSITGGLDADVFELDKDTGVLVFSAAPNYESAVDSDSDNSYNFEVSAKDGSFVVTQDITVTVLDINESPIIAESVGGLVVDEDAIATEIDLTTLFSDDDNDTLSYEVAILNNSDLISLSNTDDQTVTVSYNKDEHGTAIFEIYASDDEFTVTETVRVTVNGMNDEPVITSDDSINVTENESIVLTVTATDTEGSTVTFSISGGDDAALFEIDTDTGALSFTAAPDYETTEDSDDDNVYTVTVSAGDGSDEGSQDITVTVVNINESPIIANSVDDFVVDEDAAVTEIDLSTLFSDPENDTLSYDVAVMSNSDLVTLTNSDDATVTISYTENDSGTAVIEVYASDSEFTVTESITITVNAVNDVPVIVSADSATVTENETAVLTVEATDVEESTVTYSIAGGDDAEVFAIDKDSGELVFSVAPDYESADDLDENNSYSVIVSATDGTDLSTQSITVTVTNINESPVIASSVGNMIVDEDASPSEIDLSTLFSDPESDTLSIDVAIISNSDLVALTNSDDQTVTISYTEEASGTAVIEIYASDAEFTVTESIIITVNSVNDLPVFTSLDTATVSENETVVLTVAATDVEESTVTYSITGGDDASAFEIDSDSGELLFSVAPDYEAESDSDSDNIFELIVGASDGTDISTQAVTVTVVDINESPVIASSVDDFVVDEDAAETEIDLSTLFSDPENDTLRYDVAIISNSDLVTVTNSDDATVTISYTENDNGTAVIEIYASDDEFTVTETITITVNAINDVPVISSADSATVSENETAVLTVVASDTEESTITYSIRGGDDASAFEIDSDSGELLFSVAPDYEAEADSDGDNIYELIVGASDGTDISTQAVTVTVVDINESPVIVSSVDDFVVDEDAAATEIDLTTLFSDPENDTLRYDVSIISNSDLVTLTNSDDATVTISYTENDNGTAVIEIYASDDEFTVTETITITVNAINDVPVISSADSATVSENETAVLTVEATDTEGVTVTYSITGGDDASVFEIDTESGALVFTAAPDYEANADSDSDNSYELIVGASDGTDTTTQAITVTVVDVNESPYIDTAIEEIVVDEDASPTEINLSDLFADPESDTLSIEVSVKSNSELVTLTNSDNQIVTVTYTENDNGNAVIEIVASDDEFTVTETIFITVNVINDIPVITGSPDTTVYEGHDYAFKPEASDVETTNLEFSIQNKPSWASFDTETGKLSGTPDQEHIGEYDDIEIGVTDGDARVSLNSFSIEVYFVNDPPTINGTPDTTVYEDSFYSFTPTAENEEEDDTLVFSILNQPAWASFDTETGALFGTPNVTDIAEYINIEIGVSDGGTRVSLDAFSIEVIEVNDAPVIAGVASINAYEDAFYSFVPVASDEEGNDLLFSGINLPEWARFDSSTGALYGTPNVDHIDTIYSDIEIGVTDGESRVSLDVLKIEVIEVNDAPIISGVPTETAYEDAFYSFSPEASDEEGATLEFSILNQPEWASFDSDTGTLFGTPNVDHIDTVYSGIEIAVTDGETRVSLDVFEIEIVEVNDAPVIGGEPSDSVNEDSAYSFTPTVSDEENDSLTFSVLNLPVWASFDNETGTVFGTPNVDHIDTVYEGIEVAVSDGEFVVSMTAFSIEVIEVDDLPVISGTPGDTVYEDTGYSFKPTASDEENAELVFSVVNLPEWASFDTATGELYGTANVDYVGDLFSDIKILVSDGENTVSLPVFTIEVLEVNDAPVISGVASENAYEDSEYTFTPTATDEEGDDLVFSIANLPVWAKFDSSTGTLSGTPTVDHIDTVYEGIEIAVTDGLTRVSLDVFEIEVIEVNDAPVLSGTPTEDVYEDNYYNFSPVASDEEGDVLEFSIVNKPEWATFDSETGQLFGTPNVDHINTVYEDIVIAVFDGEHRVSLDSFNIEVVEVNDLPVISGTASDSVYEDTLYTFTPTASDEETSDLSYLIVNQPEWAEFNDETGELFGTPNTDHIDSYEGIQIAVTDGEHVVSLSVFSIDVIEVNDPPSISGDPGLKSYEDRGYSFVPTVSDEEGDSLVFTIVNQPEWAFFNSETGELYGTSNVDHIEIVYEDIQIAVSDGVHRVSLDAFSIEVIEMNDVPEISGTASENVLEDQFYSFVPSSYDEEGDDLEFSVVNKPEWAEFDSTTGALFGTPNVDHINTVYEDIMIGVSDGSKGANLESFSITVIEVNDLPVLTAIPSESAYEDAYYYFEVEASDEETATLSFRIENKPEWASFDSKTGALFGTPNVDHVGVYEAIEISVSDGENRVSADSFDLEVIEVNDPPVIIGSPSTSVLEDHYYSFIPNASDEEGSDLSFVIRNMPEWASFDSDTGALTGTPNVDHVGMVYEEIKIGVSDGTTFVQLADVFTIDVIEVNDSPVLLGTPDTEVNEDERYSFEPVISDEESDVLTINIVNKPVWADFNTETGALTGVPENGQDGLYDDIKIVVTDGLSTVSMNFSITVNGVDDAPEVIAPGFEAISVDEDAETVTLNLGTVFRDVDNTVLVYSVSSNTNAAVVTTNISDDVLSLSFLKDQFGDAAIEVVLESGGKVTSDVLEVSVVSVPDVPEAIGVGIPDLEVDEDSEDIVLNMTSYFMDGDGDELSYEVSSNNNKELLTAKITDKVLRISLEANRSGKADIELLISAGDDSLSHNFSVSVNASDDSPTVIGTGFDKVNVDEDSGPVEIDLTTVFEDIDGDAFTYSIVANTNEDLFSTEIEGDTLSLLLEENQFGAAIVVVEAESEGETVSDILRVTVNAVNDAPIFVGTSNVTITSNQKVVSGDVLAVDVEDSDITYNIVGGADAALFEINESTGALSAVEVINYLVRTDADKNGLFDLIVSASDGDLVVTRAMTVRTVADGDSEAIVIREDTRIDEEAGIVGTDLVVDNQSTVIFTENVEMTNTNINVESESTLVFEENVDADSASITAKDNSTIDFEKQVDSDSASITAEDNSHITFAKKVSMTEGQVVVKTKSSVKFKKGVNMEGGTLNISESLVEMLNVSANSLAAILDEESTLSINRLALETEFLVSQDAQSVIEIGRAFGDELLNIFGGTLALDEAEGDVTIRRRSRIKAKKNGNIKIVGSLTVKESTVESTLWSSTNYSKIKVGAVLNIESGSILSIKVAEKTRTVLTPLFKTTDMFEKTSVVEEFREGDSFKVLDAERIEGEFESVELPELEEGLKWDTRRLYNTGVISVVSTVLETDIRVDALAYPNPMSLHTDGRFEIGFYINDDAVVTVYVYDMLGRLQVKKDAMVTFDEYNRVPISESDFPGGTLSAGIYFYLIEENGKIIGKGKVGILP